MAEAIIATVTAIEGRAWARNADGQLRELQVGDRLRQGETLITPEGSEVELALVDGQSITVADIPEITLDVDMLAEAAATAEEAALQEATLDEVITALAEDGDLSELLEAAAAGGAAGNAGSSFVRLTRVSEELPELTGANDASGAVEPLVIEQQDALPGIDANPDRGETPQGEPLTLAVLDNDAFVDGALVTAVTDPQNGTAVLNSDGTITYTPDPDFSGQDSFSYTLLTPDGNLTDTASVTVDVIADTPPPPPAPLPAISVADAVVTEGDTAAIVVSLSSPSAETVTVNVATVDGTATLAGNDYDPVTGTLTFQPGQTGTTVLVDTNADDEQEGTERFSVSLSEPTNATIADGTGTVEITDDFSPTIAIGDVSVTEGGLAEFTLTLSAAVGQAVTVGFATADDTATVTGGDYDPATGTVTFAPGATTATVQVQTNTDDLVEGNERALVDLSDPVNATISDARGVLTIADGTEPPAPPPEEPPPPPPPPPPALPEATLALDPVAGDDAVTVDEVDGVVSLTVTGSVGADVQPGDAIVITFGDGTEFDSVVNPDGTTFTVTVPVDTVLGNDTITGTVSGEDESGQPYSATASRDYAVDIDQQVVSISDESEPEGTDLVFDVSLSPLSAYADAGDHSFTLGDVTTSPTDYGAVTFSNGVTDNGDGTLTIPAGVTGFTVTVAGATDEIQEANETFTVNIDGVSGATGTGTIIDDDAAPQVLVDNVTVNEAAGTLTFTLTRVGESELESSIDYTVNPGTATTPADFGGMLSGTVTFAAGESSRQVAVDIVDDSVDELDESFTIDLGNPVNLEIADGQGTGTITDDDDAPTLSVGDVSVEEGGTASFTVTLDGGTDREVSVQLTTADGSALALADGAGDYDAATGTLTFPAAPGETSRALTFEVATNDDTLQESDESFTVTLGNPTNATIEDGEGEATIVDNESAPAFSIADVSVSEGSVATVTITRSGDAQGEQSVTVASLAPVAGTDTADADDFTVLGDSTLTFAQGETEKTVTLATSQDDVLEGPETFRVQLSNPTGGATISDETGVVTILDDGTGPDPDGPGGPEQPDDDTPTVSIAGPATVAEDGVSAEYTISLSNPSELPITVAWSTAPGTATEGADYTGSSGSVTFAPGETEKTISVPILDDNLDEPDEDYTVALGEITGPATVDDGSLDTTIIDNDGAPVVTVDDVTVDEDAGTLTFTLGKTGTTVFDGSVDFTINPGTATTPADFGGTLSGTVSFAANETSRTVVVSIADDDIDELDESFTIDLDNPVNLAVADNQGVGTIIDNDDPPTLSINDVSVEEGVPASFTVTLTGQTDRAVSVQLATADGSAVALTAGNGDYDANSGTLTFPAAPGATSQSLTFEVVTNDDAVQEVNETFAVNLSNATNATISDGQGEATIVDADSPPQVTVNDVSVNEAEGTLTFTLTKTGDTTLGSAVDYTINPGTATTPSDFGGTLSGTVGFAANETSRTVSVSILDDGIDEPDETLTIDLSNPVNLVVADSQGIGTIIDNDNAPTLSIDDVSVTEGQTATFTVTLAGQTDREVSVRLTTADGSAVALTAGNGDYDATTGTLTFTANPGATSQTLTFAVATNDDVGFEPAETFTVRLSNPTNATIADGRGVATISDNDDPPAVTVNDVTVNEDDGTLTFTLTKAGATDLGGAVDFTINPGSATTPADYSGILSGTVVFTAGQTSRTVTIDIVDDALFEATENLTINLSNAQNLSLDDSQGLGTILDDDAAPQFRIADVSVSEGSTATITIIRSGDAQGGQSVDVASLAPVPGTDTAEANDFTALGTTTVAFAQGETSKTVTIATRQDEVFEGPETFRVQLSNPTGGATISDDTGVVTILDDGTGPEPPDDDRPTVSISGPVTVNEDAGTATYTISLSNRSEFPVSVDYATSNGPGANPAIAGSDYTASSGTVTFAANEVTRTITVAITDDALDEPDEAYTVTLSNVQGEASLGTSTAGTAILDNDMPGVNVGNPGLTTENITVTEGENAVFGVQVNNAAAGSTLTLQLADGTALDADYFDSGNGGFFEYSTDGGSTWTAVSGAISLAAGDTALQVRTDTIDDARDEGDETFTLTATLDSNGTAYDDTATATIVDNDAITVASVSDVAEVEGTDLTHTVTLSGAPAAAVTLAFSWADGSASAGSDYGTPPTFSDGVTYNSADGTVTVPAGVASFDVTFSGLGDSVDEPNETYTLTVGGQSGTGTVTDDDTPGVNVGNPGLTTENITVTEGENAVFGVQVNNAAAGSTLTLQLADGTALDADYFDSGNGGFFEYSTDGGSTWTAVSGAISLAAGDTALQVRTDTIDDARDEGDETFTLTATLDSNGTAYDDTATATIVDNDAITVASVSDVTEVEGTDLTHTVTLSGAPAAAVTLAFSWADGSASAGSDYGTPPTFSDGVTYNSADGTVTVPAGVASFDVTFSGLGDSIDEPNETYTLTVGGRSGTGTVTDDDTPGVNVGNPGLTTENITVTEGENAVFGVQVNNAAAGSTLTLQLADGTALDADYFDSGNGGFFEYSTDGGSTWTAVSGAISLAAGDTALQVRTDTIDDARDEGDETFTLTATLDSNGTAYDDTATATIVDNDAITVASVSDVTEVEGTDLTHTVTLSGAPAAAVTLAFSWADGSASAGSDYGTPPTFSDGVTYNSADGTVTVPAGVASFDVTFSGLGDSIDEPNETYTLTVGGRSGTGTVTDDDTPGVNVGNPGLTTENITVTEGENAVFGVQVNNAAAGSTLTLQLADGTALDADYFDSGNGGFFEYSTDGGSTWTAVSGAISLAAGDTALQVRTDTIDDARDEGDETFTLTATLDSNGTAYDDTATATIVDNDAITVASVSDVTEVEGTDLTHTVTLSGAPAAAVTLAFSWADGSASAGSDYGTPPTFSDGVTYNSGDGTVTVPAGVASFDVTFSGLGDSVDEPNETYTLTVGGRSGTGTVTDDDTPGVNVGNPGLTTENITVTEGENAVFGVQVNNAAAGSTLTLQLADGTALDADYFDSGNGGFFEYSTDGGATWTAVSGAISLAAGDTALQVRTDTIDDAREEGDETFTLTATLDSNGTAYDDTATATIVDHDDDSPSGVSATGLSVDEDDLSAAGNPGGPGDLGTPSTTGTISFNLGADTPLQNLVLSTSTAVYTLDGVAVETTWDAANDTLIGFRSGGSSTDDQVFAIAVTNITDSGAATEVTLLEPVRHHLPADADDVETDLSITVDVTVTDQDGSEGTTNFALTIDDDVPTVTQDGQTGGNLRVDEAEIVASATADFSAAFGASYGADGESATDSRLFSLDIAGANVASGLVHTASGDPVVMNKVGQDIVGTVQGSGQEVFRVSVDASGRVTLQQSRAVQHPDTNATDEVISVSSGAINLVQTITDGDGDSAQGSIDLGPRLEFQDDAPQLPDAVEADLPVPVSTISINQLGAVWTNVNAETGGSVDIVDNDSADGDINLRWGNSTGEGRSGYDFNLAATPISLNTDFDLGTFTHNNLPITGFALDNTDLEVSFDVVIDGVATQVDLVVEIDHNETPNTNSNPDDIITITSFNATIAGTGGRAQEITVGQRTYEFRIDGFRDATGQPVTQVFTEEGQRSSFTLQASIFSTGDLPTVGGQVSGSVFGADGPGNNQVAWDNETAGAVQGTYGVLDVSSDGTWTYTMSRAERDSFSGDDTEEFAFSVVDNDGDRAESTLIINLDEVPNSVPPIALDLDGDGVEYLSRQAGVVFTEASTGEALNTAWVAGDDGLLVVDANNSGTVDETREFVFTEWSKQAETDMEAVAEVFDTNQNQKLDSGDAAWSQFAVWQDRNSDGKTDQGEMVFLEELGVDSIALNYNEGSTPASAADGDVVIHGQSAVTWTDGSTSIAEDTSFAVDPLDLRDLVASADEDDLSAYLDVSYDGANTVVKVSSSGGFTGSAGDANLVDQVFTFEGMNLVADLNGQDAIQAMIDAGKLNIDQ